MGCFRRNKKLKDKPSVRRMPLKQFLYIYNLTNGRTLYVSWSVLWLPSWPNPVNIHDNSKTERRMSGLWKSGEYSLHSRGSTHLTGPAKIKEDSEAVAYIPWVVIKFYKSIYLSIKSDNDN